jgi:hypothetical protein
MFTIRIDSSNPAHTHFTVFANGANCGTLTMRPDEFDAFQELVAGAHVIHVEQSVAEVSGEFVGVRIDHLDLG